MDTSRSSPRLVARFALGSLVAFLVIGAAVAFATARTVRARAEQRAGFHAEFAARAVLAPLLRGIDPSGPIPYRTGLALTRATDDGMLAGGHDIRVKVWRPDGSILWSDDSGLIGRRFPEERAELKEVLEGEVVSEVSNLEAAENVSERRFADRLFETYVPARTDASAPPDMVIELYQDYSVVQDDVDHLFQTLGLVFAGGLVVLYGLILPIALGASRRLREQNATLHSQAGQLSSLLTREQDTVAELRKLNEMQGEFVAVASHELRSPLTSILGNLRTLEDEHDTDERSRADMLRAARRQAERLSRLVRNVLRASRLEAGDHAEDARPVDLAEVAEVVLRDLPNAAGRVDASRMQDLPEVHTNRDVIEEVLSNLVDNALKYSPDEAPVELSASVDPEEFRVTVTDRGIGIAQGDLPAIFDRFRQLDQGNTRRFGGIGLGLHLVREMVSQLGGRIEVQSEPGNGSAFTVVVPDAVRAMQDRADGLRQRADDSAIRAR